ncbi:MAG TPA: ABC transporter permease [Gemmatimonadaceae bacterium]|nr:ABC transporter permease [Gemmatimonadaceae bacterium]
MDGLLQDVRYALRTLRKSPAFVTITVLTLALGIGANLAIFTVVNAVLLEPLPFREPERLVRVFDDVGRAGAKDIGMSVPELDDLRRSGVFEQISAIVPVSTALSGGDRVERIELLGTSPNYFELLGARPALGQTYTQAEWVPGFLDGVVISDGLWKRQFGSDPHIIGRRVRVDEDPYTIIGVMPPDFRHPGNTVGGDVDIWTGTGFSGDPFPSPPQRVRRFLPGTLGRLRPGITLEQAQQRLDALATSLQQTFPNDYPKQLGWSLRLEPAETSLTGNVRPTLVILLAAVSFVLLIACVNVASLLIARGSAHMREFAIRQALGASRGQLVRQVLTESVLISLTGGTAAVAMLLFAQRSLLALMPADVPRLAEVHADWRMVFLALVLSLATGVLVGLMPALHASTLDPNRDLRDGGRTGGGQSVRQNRSRAALVVLEVALSAVLLVGAGLLVRSFSAALSQDPGLDPERLVTGQIWVPFPNNPKANQYFTQVQRAGLVRELTNRIALLPGLEQSAVGTSSDIPLLSNVNSPLPFSLPDEMSTQENDHAAEFGAVSAAYFDVLGTPLKRGRGFTEHDAESTARVVVVSEAFVRRFSPQREAVGQRLRFIARGQAQEAQIIGVVGDVRNDGLDIAPPPRVYQSILQYPSQELAVFLRTRSDVDVKATKEALTAAVRSIDPELPVFGVMSMADLKSASMARRRFSLFLMSVFAVSALLLAALGIYGVMAFVVGQRAQEFGIRMALGAMPRNILGLAFRPGLILTAAGTIVGLAASIGVTRLMSSVLFGVSSNDPTTFAVVPAVLGIVALAACFIPARRATRVSPIQALK